MTEAPQFRVFLKDSSENSDLTHLFSNGIPCRNYLATDYNKLVPQDFVFVLDYTCCNEFQIKALFKALGEEHEYKQLDLDHHPYYIEFEGEMTVIDRDGKEWDLDILKQS
ncbi:hypothetical protein [Crocosphaera sp.]|uniref:hypothetical protein n=1 Tax=Crocosphaera sp. TaxID=2729996 RepID=UPI003F22F696|nr:hypothetical protein [Crocosphaera sp.]